MRMYLPLRLVGAVVCLAAGLAGSSVAGNVSASPAVFGGTSGTSPAGLLRAQRPGAVDGGALLADRVLRPSRCASRLPLTTRHLQALKPARGEGAGAKSSGVRHQHAGAS